MIFEGNFAGTVAQKRQNAPYKKNDEPVDSDEEEVEFYYPKDQEVLIGSKYKNVRVFMTERVTLQGKED